jgi:uncharacterized membrane protein (DUF485 family)
MTVDAGHHTRSGESYPPAEDTAIDWQAVEESPEFKELVHRKRRFVVPATIFFLAWYLGFIALAGYAEDFMGKSVYEGLTVGYVLALTQFVMVWGLSWWYLRKSDREFDPLEHAVVERATRGAEPSRAGEAGVPFVAGDAGVRTDREVQS